MLGPLPLLPPGPGTRRAAAALLWLLLLGLLAAAVGWPEPLLVNLGAGDEPFARGFRGGWERDGLHGSGETQFRWTLDGARLQLPFTAAAARAEARLRVARFAAGPADVTLLAGERVAARWRQPPRGWRVERVDLGPLHGPLLLQFRSQSADGTELGVALDWVELRGVESLRPSGAVMAGLLALLLGVPLLAGLVAGRLDATLWAGAALAGSATGAVALDRFGGLLALSTCGPPLLLVLALLAVLALGLSRAWPEQLQPWRGAYAVSAAFAVVALAALSHPFFHYPDVDTHARFVAALREDPALLFDASAYQARTGAWTREVAGQRVAFPYSPVFHLLALPLAALWDDVRAVKALAVLAAAATVLLAHAMARAVGLTSAAARGAQALLALLPVMASRLTLALYPALLGQALEAALLVHLMRRLSQLVGARDAAAAFGILLLTQIAYTGSLINAAALVAALAVADAVRGEWRRAARLLGAWALAAALVVAALYVPFLPVLWQQVLPHLHAVPGEAPVAATPLSLLRLMAARLNVFYGFVLPPLAALGLYALRRADPFARRVLACALAAAAALLVLRFVAPSLFRDAKEVELMAAPVAVAAVAALAAWWRRGGAVRVAALALGTWTVAWGAWRAVEFYAARFLSVGRIAP
jgi:hypothetical protein